MALILSSTFTSVLMVAVLFRNSLARVIAGEFLGGHAHEKPVFGRRERAPYTHSGPSQDYWGKRLFDITAAISVLVFTAPVLVLVAIAIPLDSRGSILYRQKRVGLNGEVFDIYKFRSMGTDAEKNGAVWAAENDPRVTRVGKIIRHLRIDEIPQAINVLRGEMSFVGPRPERPEFVEILEKEIPGYQQRHCVKPGITGWAQVKHEYGASVDDARIKLMFDLDYVNKFSLLRDALIVLMTVRVACFGIGSR